MKSMAEATQYSIDEVVTSSFVLVHEQFENMCFLGNTLINIYC